MNKKDIEDLVKKKKEELKGLISEEGALFVIAKDLGVDVKEENKELLREIDINISDITSNMKNLTLIGRIKDVYDIRSFNKKDGSEGHVGSFLLSDSTGDIRIVLWDEHTSILNNEEFVKNEMVKIINGYAKQGINGRVEVQIGRLGKIIIAPEDVDVKKYPKIKDKALKVEEVNLNQRSISIEGKIIQKFPIKEFSSKSGDIGRLCSLILADDTGTIRITFWNEDISNIEAFKIGDNVIISSLNPKLNNLDKKTIDLNAGRNTNVKKTKKELELDSNLVEKIKDLQNKKNSIISFRGIVSSVDNLKNITLKTEEIVSLLGFTVSDDTDYIRVTLWRETAEEYSKLLKKGKGISLKNVMTKYSTFSNRNEISFLKDSSLEIIELKMDNIKYSDADSNKSRNIITGNYTKIDSINSPGYCEIKGFIAKEIKNITIYEACSKCFKKIENCNCEVRGTTLPRMILNLIIDDETGTIRTTFIGDSAEKIIGYDTEKIFEMKDTSEFESFLEKKSSELLGKDIVVRGKIKYSDFTSSYELIADIYQEVNVSEELNRTVEELGI